MNVHKVWTVHRNADDHNDGPITDVCAHEALAMQVAKGGGWYGGNAPVVERWAITTDGRTYLIDQETKGEPVSVAQNLDEIRMGQEEKVKRAALAKLTPDERRALGLG
jgi:hypothetical protein